jgi:diguanylate cyclase (GGDEF)-like protein
MDSPLAKSLRRHSRLVISLLAVCTLLLSCTLPRAYASTTGSDLLDAGVPATTFIPFDNDTLVESYTLARLPRGDLVVGTSAGLLRYDGERWHLTAAPNGQLIRSLLVDSQGQLWVGGYDLFAKADFGPNGDLVLQVLSEQLPDTVPPVGFADIWNIREHGDQIWFRGVRDLFRYDRNNGEIQHFRHADRFGDGFIADGNYYLQFRHSGLHRFDGKRFERVSDHPLWQEHVLGIMPTPDGRWLGHNRDGEWLLITPDQVERFDFPGLSSGVAYFDYRTLSNGDLAMAGRDGAIHIIDFQARRYRRLPIAEDPLFHLTSSREGGVLAVTDLGVVHMAWPAEWSALGAAHGLRGNIHGVYRWNQQWLSLTHGDAMIWSPQEDRFEEAGWTPHEAWTFLALDQASALLGDSYSLLHIQADGRSPQPISSATLYPRLLQPSRWREELILVGTELGIAAVQWRPGQAPELLWTEASLLSRIDSITELSEREWWLGTATRGVIKVQLNEDGQISSLSTATVPGQTSEQYAALTFLHQDTLHVSTANGVFRWNGEQFHTLPASQLPASKKPKMYRFFTSAAGQRWAYSDNQLFAANADQWSEVTPYGLRRGAFQIINEVDGHLLVSANARVLLRRPTMSQPARAKPASAPRVQLQSMELRLGEASWQPLPLATKGLQVPAEDFALAFRYALPSIGAEDSTQYRARLLGYEDEFSDWSRSTRITYSRLRPGDYTFEVIARDHLGRISQLQPFHFTAVPPWYASWPMQLLFALLAMAALVWVVRALIARRTGRLQAEQRRLSRMVEERTEALSIANQKLEAMAHLDGLTGIANRRRLDNYLSDSLAQCQQRQRPLSIILFDVDHFKAYNDQNGHQAGDAVLEGLAEEASGCLRRQEDLLARYGGEEFIIIMPGASTELAVELAEELRNQIAGSPLGITISAGVASTATSTNAASSPASLLAQADQALYQAKHEGRDRVRKAD